MIYTEEDLVRVAKRENNKRRAYLVVNPMQGKHIPASPSKSLELFSQLAKQCEASYKTERLLVIGFAETATAIGAQVAISLGAPYMHTTREELPDVGYIFFSEEHSHAIEQKIVKDDLDVWMREGGRILFIEDEITTGRTILNIIRQLKKRYGAGLSYAAASLLNGMTQEHVQTFEKKGIGLHYLVKTDHSDYENRVQSYTETPADGPNEKHDEKNDETEYEDRGMTADGPYPILHIRGVCDTRRLVEGETYASRCQKLWENIRENLVTGWANTKDGKHIAVIGTEECMYPSLYIGRQLEQLGYTVRCHSTTRSPICVSHKPGYPLYERHALPSLYDEKRRTFLYNIDVYDRVLVVTDAPELSEKMRGAAELARALRVYNDDITFIRWC